KNDVGSVEKLSLRKQRFMLFSSLEHEGEYYMTPRDFLFSVMFEQVERKTLVKKLARKSQAVGKETFPAFSYSHIYFCWCDTLEDAPSRGCPDVFGVAVADNGGLLEAAIAHQVIHIALPDSHLRALCTALRTAAGTAGAERAMFLVKMVVRSATVELLATVEHAFSPEPELGLISYTEYLFLLTILTKPHTGFHVAFKMLDADGNEMIERKEFVK
ncbi:hypothetical protein U0070_014964, partial [Myodes glareolus]